MNKLLLLVFCLFVTPSMAETFEIKMLNRGEKGPMVFEPDFLQLQPGDSVKFIATHPSHNAASIPEIWPEGTPSFKGKINEEIEVTFTDSGFYGVRCIPHYGMGMAMLIKVGDASIPQISNTIPIASKERLETTIQQISK